MTTPQNYITCKVCDRGSLANKRVHRMSGPAVVIGYILLIPSIAAIAFCALCILIIQLQSMPHYVSARQAAISEMRDNSVPEEVITQVVAHPRRDPADYISDPGIPMVQYSWVKDATQKLRHGSAVRIQEDNASVVGRRLGEGMLFFVGLSAFISGLLGWLLVMKKRVLQCSTCNAVVNAS
jgi:hypothetical protein